MIENVTEALIRQALPFRIEARAGKGDTIILALAASRPVAEGAYHAAIDDDPTREVSLVHEGRVVRTWKAKPKARK